MRTTLGIYLIFIVIGLWFTYQILYPASQTLTHGFGAYYSAAYLLKTGQLSAKVYDPVYFRSVVRATSQQRADDIYNANPPTTSLIFWPLSFLPIEQARLIWLLVDLTLLFGSLTLLLLAFMERPVGPTWAVLFSLGMMFQPVIQNIKLGQAYLLILFLLALAVVAFDRGRAWLGGAALALALTLKTAGWALIPLLIWQKKWRYLIWTIGLAGIVLLLTLPLLPIPMWQRYLQLLPQTSNSPITCVAAYQTTRSLLCRLFVFEATWNTSPIFNLPWLAPIILVGLAGLTLILNFKLSHTHQTLALIAMIIWGIIFAPLGEQYHHTVMLIPITWLITRWPKDKLTLNFSQIALLVAICFYLIPFPLYQLEWQTGWWAFVAYPRLYGAWLILLALYSQLAIRPITTLTPAPELKPSGDA